MAAKKKTEAVVEETPVKSVNRLAKKYKEEIVRVFQERLPWAITHPMAMDFQRIFSDVLPTLIHPKSHILAIFKIVENLVPHK